MYLNLSLLFLSALLSGIAVFFVPHLNIKRFKIILTFSGAYLFSITVIHILPELFHENADMRLVGIYVLSGFFLQMVLEYFTSGVEHGHIHTHDIKVTHIPYSMLISLSLHSFLEGTLLVHPSHIHNHAGSSTLLYGLILHKIPESFALMSVLVFSLQKKYTAMIMLLLFACTSPAGLLLSNTFYSLQVIPGNVFVFLFALVAGNFLYISTTIFFETSPDHTFKANKLMVSLLGAAMAILAEFFLNR
jgi:zinc and cadmium transporter